MKYRISDSKPGSADQSDLLILSSSFSSTNTLLQSLDASSSSAVIRIAETAGWSQKCSRSICFPIMSSIEGTAITQIHILPRAKEQSKRQQCCAAGAYLAGLSTKTDHVAICFDREDPASLLAHFEQLLSAQLHAMYRFEKYKSSKSNPVARSRYTFHHQTKLNSKLRAAVKRCMQVHEAVSWAKDLVNTPAADLGPKDFVAEVKGKLAKSSRISTRVHDEKKLKSMKAGAILAVSQGSTSKPYLLHLTYRPKKKSSRRVVLIGKGVTYDTGGLSMKSSAGMLDMKCDMAGAAAVAGVFAAINKANEKDLPRCEVHGIIPLAENMVSANALRPGDIIQSMSGKTVEVVNTDAEGRLLLADALCYSKRIKADTTIDIATLTGACCAALGDCYAGVFTESDSLSAALCHAGETSGDLLWPLPLAKAEYRKLLDSTVADVKNAGSTPPGASTAALFLQEFVPESTEWAHLDIAGPAFLSSPYLHRAKGATGFGVALLLSYLAQLR